MNGLESDRMKGIELASQYNWDSHKDIKYPNLVQNIGKWKYTPDPPKDCKYQGYFY